MKNLVRLKRSYDIDHIELFHRKTLAKLPELKEIYLHLDNYVEEVIDSDSEGEVILGVAFTDLDSRWKRKHHYYKHKWRPNPRKSEPSIMVFPLYGKIEYIIRKGNFWVNLGKDPIEIMYARPLWGYTLLFSENPKEGPEKYNFDMMDHY